MTTWEAHFGQFLHQRLPFLPLVIVGVAGTLLGEYVLAPGWLAGWMALLMLGAALRLAPRFPLMARTLLLGGVVCTFAALQIWSTRESASARIASAWPGPTVVEATVRVDEPPRPYGEDRSAFAGTIRHLKLETWDGPVSFPVQIEWTGTPPTYGDLVRVLGSMATIPPPRNPGTFDLAAWMNRRGFHSKIRLDSPQDGQLIQKTTGRDLKSVALSAADWMRSTITAGLEPESDQARLIVAMTLGDTSPFDEDLMEVFRGTGTMHLFSVSGLHVGMLGMLLWLLLSAVGIPNKPRAVLIIGCLFFYALITGWKPASVRAATMGAFVLAGMVMNRPPLMINSLLAAAFFILLGDTRELFNPGFQMSFLVVFALMLLCPPLTALLQKPADVDPLIPVRIYTSDEKLRSWMARVLAPSGAVVLAAWIGSLGLTFWYFHLISLSSIPANSLCVPISFCVMGLAMMSMVAGLFSSGLAILFNNANWLCAGALLSTVQFLASLPGAWFYAPFPEANPPQAEITVFDFGAGAATALRAGGRVSLLDAGPERERERTLIPFLRERGVSRLETLVLSHGDAGHIGAAAGILAALRPQFVAQSTLTDKSPTRRAFQVLLSEGQSKPLWIKAGDTLPLIPHSTAVCLFPPGDHVASVADDKALVILLTVEGWKILFLSDAGPSTWHWLLTHSKASLLCDVIVQGANRGGVAAPAEFWEETAPMAVISTSHDFPSSESLPEETLSNLHRLGVRLFRQDQTGAVTIRIEEDVLSVDGFLDHSHFSTKFPEHRRK